MITGEKMPSWLDKTARILWEAPLSFTRVLMVVLSVVTSALVVVEVAVRYVVFSPQLWVEELILYLVIWFYFAGAVYATYKRTHITGGIIHLIFKSKPIVLESVHAVAAAICLGLCCIMVALALNQFQYSLQMNPRTIHLLLPLAYSRLAILVGFALMILYFLVELIGSIRHLIHLSHLSKRGGH